MFPISKTRFAVPGEKLESSLGSCSQVGSELGLRLSHRSRPVPAGQPARAWDRWAPECPWPSCSPALGVLEVLHVSRGTPTVMVEPWSPLPWGWVPCLPGNDFSPLRWSEMLRP